MIASDMLKIAYELLPPPLSALPAKYHAPISLLLHSLSTGMIAHNLAEIAELEDYKDVAFILGLTHDIHQKLVEDTLKNSKEYIKKRLDELGLSEYYRYVDDALEVDACGKGNPVRNLPKELSIICHIGDMAQGRLEAYALLYWLWERVKELKRELAVRFYGVMIPQPFARSYIIHKIYDNHISKMAESWHVALASPWGLYVVAREDELPEVLEVSWDELRIDDFPLGYDEIKEIESNKDAKKEVESKLKISNYEIEYGVWSKFARMFFSLSKLGDEKPLNPILPTSTAGFFVNIRFTDIEFKDFAEEISMICPLCSLAHHRERAFGVNIYPKIAGVDVTTEKWNRKLPGHIKVRGWEGQWKYGYGLDPLCALDAVAIRELKVVGLNGVISVSIPKPIPIQLLAWIALMVRDRSSYRQNPDTVSASISNIDELSRVGGVAVDYVAAMASTLGVGEPITDNMFSPESEISNIGFLIALGLYPVKYLETLDSSIPDRLLTTAHTFTLTDFPVTAEEFRNAIPWVAALLQLAGEREKSEGIEILQTHPRYAPLRLLSLNKGMYTHVSNLLSQVGVKP